MSKWLLQLIANLGIEREDNEPFTVAALYEIVEIGEQIIRSMTMLTINADDHPFMSQFHKPKDEKRSIVVIEPQQRMDWLNMTHESAYKLLLLIPHSQLEISNSN